jgi:hypothetical protein
LSHGPEIEPPSPACSFGDVHADTSRTVINAARMVAG